VFNSCAVTAEAEADLRQSVRRAARAQPMAGDDRRIDASRAVEKAAAAALAGTSLAARDGEARQMRKRKENAPLE